MEATTSIADLVDAAATRWPNAPMLTFFEEEPVSSLTFSEAQHRSTVIAGTLAAMGVTKGTPVAVTLPNLPVFPLAWLALARLGAIMVPINPRFTAEEFAFVFGDADIRHAITHADVRALLPDDVAHEQLLVWHGDAHGHLQGPGGTVDLDADIPDALWPTVGSDDPVGIHYTSGTTGFPKGCVLDHRSWLIAAETTLGLLPRVPQRILSDAPFFYIDALFECCMSLMCGAEQFVARKVSLSRFTRWLVDFDIDYAEIWEAFGSRTLDPQAEADLRRKDAPVMLTSFGLPGHQHAELERRFNAIIREMYGMTEIGLATAMPFSDTRMASSGSCGLATPYRETRVVDPETLLDVPAGHPGELWVRGPGVMQGYHNRPEVNAACFPGDGWFRTGDLFTKDSRGYHAIIGRLKDMIRRSHENIAAAEVEAAVATTPGVVAAAVVGVPDSFRGEEVKAFVVIDSAELAPDEAPAAVVTHASASLAAFKVPRYVEVLDELPLTASGKVAKVTLRARDDREIRGFDRVDNVWRP